MEERERRIGIGSYLQLYQSNYTHRWVLFQYVHFGLWQIHSVIHSVLNQPGAHEPPQ